MKRSYIYIYIIILYLVCLIPFFGNDIRIGWQLWFEYGAILCFSFVLIREVNIWLGLGSIFFIISSIYPYYTKWSYIKFNNILYGLILYYILVKYVDIKDIEKVLNCICIICLINILQQVIQVYHGDLFYLSLDGSINRIPLGFLSTINEINSLYILCIPCFLRKKWWLCLFGIVYGLWLARCSTGIIFFTINLIIISIYYIGFYYNFCFFSGIFIIFIIYSYNNFLSLTETIRHCTRFTSPGIRARIILWRSTFPLIWRRYKVGNGLGNWKDIIYWHDYYETLFWQKIKMADGEVMWDYAHNDIYQIFFETGIGFLILFIGYLGRFIKNIYLRKDRYFLINLLILINILCCSSIYFCWHNGILAIIMIFLLSFVEINIKHKMRREKCV